MPAASAMPGAGTSSGWPKLFRAMGSLLDRLRDRRGPHGPQGTSKSKADLPSALRDLARPDRLPGPGQQGLGVGGHLRRDFVVALEGLSLVGAERPHPPGLVVALRSFVHLKVKPASEPDAEYGPTPVEPM